MGHRTFSVRRSVSASALVRCCAATVVLVGMAPMHGHAARPAAYSQEHGITIDATKLSPSTRWQVPGVTPMIMSLDPEFTDAYATTEPHVLTLKPGRYHFGTFTFDFPFEVTLEGTLDFARSLNQCVEGRGTRTLTVHCSRTQPYGGQPEY